jgi:hypothetical protein
VHPSALEIARELPGVRARGFPGFVDPLLATLRNKAPSTGEWLHEIKFDGYRTQAHIVNRRPAIYTRRGFDWTKKFAPIGEALKNLAGSDVILDAVRLLCFRLALSRRNGSSTGSAGRPKAGVIRTINGNGRTNQNK